MHRDPVPAGSFRVITISEVAYNLMHGLEAAATQVERATTPTDIHAAYGLLTRMREPLATYISELEKTVIAHGSTAVEQNIIVRFK